jgi:predicted O-methyltransferase YrrM
VPEDPQQDAGIGTTRIRDVLAGLFRTGTAIADTDGSVHSLFPVAVSAAEGEAIRTWVIAERAVATIEIGLGYGISALFACEGLLAGGDPRARHVVIDPFQKTRFASLGLQFLREAGVAGLVTHYDEQSQIVLPRLFDERRQFDLAVVDGNHRFDAVFVDLYYLGRLLRPGSVIFLDDYQLPGVARAAAFFTANLGWAVEEASADEDRHHWAVLRTSTETDSRPFDYLADF